MVIDAADRPAASSEFVGKALARKAVIGKRIARKAFDIVDAILFDDRRVAELLGEPDAKRPRVRGKKH